MAGPIEWLARSGRVIAPCALLGWFAAVVWRLLEARVWPDAWTSIFLAGGFGLALWLGAALALLPCGFVAARARPDVGFDRSAWQLMAAAATCLMIAFWPLRAAIRASLPRDLAYLDELASAAAAYAGWAVAAAFAWLSWRRWRQDRPFPFWALAPAYIAARGLAAGPIEQALPGREALFDALLLAVLCGCAFGIAQRLRGRWLVLLSAAWASSSLLLCVRFDAQPAARAAFAEQFAGAAALVARIGALVDVDDDGVSAWLGGADCDDLDPAISPFALEIVGNGIDDNCSGADLKAHAPATPVRAAAGVERSSLVLITADTVRADMLDARHMPQLTRFVQGGAHFVRAYSAAPYTTDSLRSMMTGQWVPNISLGFGQDLGSEATLAERLRAAGYDTSLVMHRWWHTPGEWTSYRGFARVIEAAADRRDAYRDVVGPQVTKRALAELSRLGAQPQPFFLWIHYLDAHAEYAARAGTPFSGGSDLRSRYAQEVWATDREIGRVLDHLQQSGFMQRGLCVVHSDHGELIDDRGRTGHALWLDEDVLRVVLALRGAGVPAGRFNTRVRLVDVYPTLLRLTAGISAPSAGEDLGPVWQGVDRRDRDVIVYSSYAGTRQSAILHGNHKLVQNYLQGTLYLYDLARDASARHNRVEAEPHTTRALQARYGLAWDQSMNDAIMMRRARQAVEQECAAGNARACAALSRTVIPRARALP